MRKVLAAVLSLLALPAAAQTPPIIPNDGSTGTTLNYLAKDNGSGAAVVCSATTDLPIGVVTANAGKTGSATVISTGLVPLYFVGSTTAGHYATFNSACQGVDAGASPTSGPLIGIVQTTGSGAGVRKTFLTIGWSGIGGLPVNLSGPVAITNSTPSTSPTTGALTVVGGLGVGGAIWTSGGFAFTKALVAPDNSGNLAKSGFVFTESASGSASTPYSLNLINQTADTVVLAPGSLGTNTDILYSFGGGAMTGNRTALNLSATLTATTGNVKNGSSYGAFAAEAFANANDNGTGVTNTTSSGQFQTENIIARAGSTATNLYQMSIGEYDIEMDTGSSAYQKLGLAIVQLANDKVQGSSFDAALNIANASGAVGWKNGLLFGRADGVWPFASDAVGITCYDPGSGCGSMASFIDMSHATFTGNSVLLPGFRVESGGNINLATGNFIGFQGATPLNSTNWSLYGDGTNTILNALTGGSIGFNINNVSIGTWSASGLNVPQSIAATSTTTGALTVPNGGLGVGGAIFAGGNVNAPAFVPTGSTVPTNGLYLPAPNAVGIATNSTPSIYVDSFGNVGIGTTGPGYKLDVGNFSTAVSNTIRVAAPAGYDSALMLKEAADAFGFTIKNVHGLSLNGLNIIRHSADATGVSAMFIGRDSGNVGIGTTTPGSTLQVNGGAAIGYNASTAAPTNGVTVNGHIAVTGTAPTLSACGTGSPSLDANATDSAGTVTEGTTATGCTVTFATAYATAPHCVVSGSVAYTMAPATTTAFTVANLSATGDTFSYICVK